MKPLLNTTRRIGGRATTLAATMATLAGLGLAPATPAHAQGFDAVRSQPGADVRRVGLGFAYGREFSGSSRNEGRAVPLLDFQWRNGWFAGTANGIGVNLSNTAGLAYGARITADFGREEKDSPELRGLGDIDPAAEFGVFLNWAATDKVQLTSSLRHGAGNDGKGLVFDVGLDWSQRFSPTFALGARVAATAVNSELMRERYGVTGAQAQASGLRVHAPEGGLSESRVSVSARYTLSPAVNLLASATYTRLHGDAATSPVVRDKGWPGVFVAVTYSF